MGLLILVIIFTSMALASFMLSFLITSLEKGKKEKASKPTQDTKESPHLKLHTQINILQSELEKVKSDYIKIQNELEATKKKELGLQEELIKEKEWHKKELIDIEKIKKDHLAIKDELIKKEKELEKEFSFNLNLHKELKEDREKLVSLEKEKREMVDEIRKLKAQLGAYQKEIERHNRLILEMKKKEEESEWVSKREYHELKRKLEEKEETLKGLQGS